MSWIKRKIFLDLRKSIEIFFEIESLRDLHQAMSQVNPPELIQGNGFTFSSFNATGEGLSAVTASAICWPISNASARVPPGTSTNIESVSP